jgi:Ni,Fe-hydrogenase I cytochrome b subunit
MFFPIWLLVIVGVLAAATGMALYSLGSQNGYQAGLRAFYTVKEVNDLGRIENAKVF